MKTILAAITLVILFSCKKETTDTSTITIELNNCSAETPVSQDYQLCFDSLWDSRCPSNVVCVWQGVATVKLIFKVNNQQHVVRLSTSTIAPDFIQDTTVAGYHLKLINVLPYPVHPNNPQGPIIATVEVTQ